MLRTPSELAALPTQRLTELQLAVLVRLGAVDPPICLGAQDESHKFLFDRDHERQMLATLGVGAKATNVSATVDYYSAGARQTLSWRPGEISDVGASIGDQNLEDFGRTEPGRLRRFWRWATSFRLFRVQLSGKERVTLHAITAVHTAQAISSLLVILLSRLTHIDSSVQDRCLSAYVEHSTSIGWGMFANELALADALIKTDPELRGLTPREALDRIASVEARYAKLVEALQGYLNDHDPEGLLIKSVVGRSVAGPIRDVISGAYSRAAREFADSLPKHLRELFPPESKSV